MARPPHAEANVESVLQTPRTWLFVAMIGTLVAMLLALKDKPWTVPFVVGAGSATLLMWTGAYFDVYMCLY